MSSIPVSVGLDYHTDTIQVSILDPAGRQLCNRSVPNDAEAIVQLFVPFLVQGVAVEACSGAAYLADEMVDRYGLTVFLAHAGYVSKLKQSPDKSDYSDARLLADLLRVGYLPRVWHAPQWIRELRTLIRYRQSLVRQRRAAKQRIGAVLREQRIKGAPARRWTLGWLLWLEREAGLSAEGHWSVMQMLEDLRYLDQKIDRTEERLRAHAVTDEMVRKLMKVKGIGLIISCTMRAEIGRFDRFRTGKQLSNFCGLSPRNASTGRTIADAGLLNQTNKELRAVILQGAHLIKRHDPRWRGLATQMQDRGKHNSVIVAAIANRWMRSLHQEMKNMGLAEPQRQAA